MIPQIFNESLGYARAPAATLAAFAPHLLPHGQFLVSFLRFGNYRAIWRRATARFDVVSAEIVADDHAHVWDIRALRPVATPAQLPRSAA